MKNMMTTYKLSTLLCGLALGLVLHSAQAARQNLEKIIAVVDNSVILQSDFDSEYRRIQSRLSGQGNALPPENILRKQVLEHLILKEVQLQAAARKGIRIDDNMLNDRIASIAAQNQISVAKLKSQLELEGTPYSEYRKILLTEMTLQHLRQRSVYDRVIVSEQEIEDYLAQNPVGSEQLEYQLKHILIAVPEEASADDIQTSQQKAQDVYKKVLAGDKFSDLAIASSDGQKALEGGDLGWFKRPQVPTIFGKALDKLQQGQTAPPIRSASGFHLVKLVELRGEQRRVVQQAKARHILIKPDLVTSMEQAREKISKLRKRISQGEEFAQLAKAHSADGSSAQGGDLGWGDPAQYVPPFQRAVEKLPLNTLSEPIRTQFGWHILEVTERRDYDETDEYRRNIARRNLRELKANEEEDLWLRRIRDQAYVEFRIAGMQNKPKDSE
jgi:peptidyl-prolyl cis-trans isomerase SurA